TGATYQSRSFRARPRASRKQHLAAAPFGAWLGTAFLETPWASWSTFGRFGRKQNPCSRMVQIVTAAVLGRGVKLVSVSSEKSVGQQQRRPQLETVRP